MPTLLTITLFIISSQRPLIFKVAAESFGVHCRFAIYNFGLSCFGLSMHHNQVYRLNTLKIKKYFTKPFVFISGQIRLFNIQFINSLMLFTFKLEPRQRITSAFSAAFPAPSQFKGHFREPLNRK